MVCFRLGSGGFFLYPFPGFIWVSTGLFFPFFPFFTLLSQYTLLLATAVAYPYLFLASLLILLSSHFSLFPSAYTMHLSYLPTNSFILSPNFNEQPSFILWGHPSPFPFSHCKWKVYGRFFLPFFLLGVISYGRMNEWMDLKRKAIYYSNRLLPGFSPALCSTPDV